MAEVHVGRGSKIVTSGRGEGNSGAITINADRMKIVGGDIATDTIVGSLAPTGLPSSAGPIVLNIRESLEMSTLLRSPGGFDGAITSASSGNGAAGDISITAPHILIDEVFIQASTTGAGRGGRILIRADDLTLRNGAQILSGTQTTGTAGSIEIDVAGRFEMRGTRFDGFNTGLVAITNGDGPGGSVFVRAGEFVIDERAFVSASTFGIGSAGSIDISARTVQLANGGAIQARSGSSGTAGAIRIAATDALRIFGGTITSEALNADGGNIDIHVGNLVHLKRGEISTAVGSGAGAGGNIFIDPTFVILEDGSRIVANAFGGPGGRIQIFATYFLNTLDSLVDASSALGVPGTVQISAPNTNLSTQIKVLPATFFDASQLVREACASRYASGAPRSSLVGVGRGGLAASPERFASSTYFADRPLAMTNAPASTGLRFATAQRARLAVDCAG